MNDTSSNLEKRVFRALSAICLVGFPLILLLVDLTGVHPGLGRGTGADQIKALADQSDAWAWVHGLFVLAGVFALASMLILRRLVAERDSTLAPEIAASIGVLGAVVFIGTVLMEVVVIPDLSEACAASPACLSAENRIFTEVFANHGWRVLPGLNWGAHGVALGLVLLGGLGMKAKALSLWEGGFLAAGGLYEFYVGTGLHAWGTFNPSSGMTGLSGVLVLIGSCGIAARILLDRAGSREVPLEAVVPRSDPPKEVGYKEG